METIKNGSKGEAVKVLQKYLGLTADGIFGKMTEQAVKTWQTKNHLTADGIVGAESWAIILGSNPKQIDSSVKYEPLNVHITKMSRTVKYLAIHYTGSSNSKPGRALNAKNTFLSGSASADFCVDDQDMVQFNPDIENYYCWAVGDSNYNNKGGSLYGKATNKNTVSIEICSTCVPSTQQGVKYANHSGWSFTDKALENAIKLAKIIMKKYNIPIDRVIRHYDISGKSCPGLVGWNDENIIDIYGKKIGTNNSLKWKEFKQRLS